MQLGRVVLVFGMALLGACNIAVSQKPLFTDVQRSTSLLLEDGLWTYADPECLVDTAKPLGEWPECGDWIIVESNKVVAGSDMKAGEAVQHIFLVDGTPALIQANVRTNGEDAFFAFLILQPTYSAARRIIAADVWPVACGTDDGPGGKVRPHAGFDKNCQPKSAASLRRAAAKPRSKTAAVMNWKWVRPEKP